MGERPLLLRALHEHRNRRPNALIDEDHESLFLVAKENGEAAAGRSYRTDLHFDNGLIHSASLPIRLHAKIRIAVRIIGNPTTVLGVLEQPDVSPELRTSIMAAPPSQTPSKDRGARRFYIVRHAFRSSVKVLNLYYIKF